MPKEAKNPVMEEHAREYELYLAKWQDKLNLKSWRCVLKEKRVKDAMGSLESVEPEHRLAVFAIGDDFKSCPVTSETLESLAIHELLHLMLRGLMEACMMHGAHTNLVGEKEHEVVIVLEDLLMKAYGGVTE